MTRTVLIAAYWLALAVWTVLLVRPTPQEAVDVLITWSDLLPLLVAKTLHLTGYGGLGCGALALFGRWKWWVFGGVALHAVLGEVCQYYGNLWFATGRTGKPLDVLIDWLGMAIGFGVWRVGMRITRRSRSATPPA